MYVMVQDMQELSTFFKRQVLLSRFIAKFAHGEWKQVIRVSSYHISPGYDVGIDFLQLLRFTYSCEISKQRGSLIKIGLAFVLEMSVLH